MPLYPLFVVLIALALRDQYFISFELVLGFLLWSPRWRYFKHDVSLLLLALLVITLGSEFMQWRTWYIFVPPRIITSLGEQLQYRLIEQIANVSHGQLNSFLNAVLVGVKGGLDQETTEAFGILGIRHMLAVSGFHVGIWTSLFLPITKVHQHRYWQWIVQLGLVGYLIIYVAAVGSGPSVIRAVGSFILARIALARHLKISSMHWPLTIAVGCFLLKPDMIQELGFQLSYAAVIAILLFLRQSPWADFLQHYQVVKHGELPFWLLTIQISVAAWIGTLPLVVYYFNYASPYFLIGNLFIVPVYTMFIWTGLTAILIGPWISIEFLEYWNSIFEIWHELVVDFASFLSA